MKMRAGRNFLLRCMWRRIGAVASIAMIVVAGTAAEANGPTRQYSYRGLTPTHSYYEGSISIREHESGISLKWEDAAGRKVSGVAIQMDQLVGGVVDNGGRGVGIVLYRVKGGELRGIWNVAGNLDGSYGEEDLLGPESLNGSFSISKGINPDNSAYRGSVDIRRKGDIYLVDWSTPQPSYVGTGALVGDILVVAYGVKERPQVWFRCVGETLQFGGRSVEGEIALAPEASWPIAGENPPGLDAKLEKMLSDRRFTPCANRPIAALTRI